MSILKEHLDNVRKANIDPSVNYGKLVDESVVALEALNEDLDELTTIANNLEAIKKDKVSMESIEDTEINKFIKHAINANVNKCGIDADTASMEGILGSIVSGIGKVINTIIEWIVKFFTGVINFITGRDHRDYRAELRMRDNLIGDIEKELKHAGDKMFKDMGMNEKATIDAINEMNKETADFIDKLNDPVIVKKSVLKTVNTINSKSNAASTVKKKVDIISDADYTEVPRMSIVEIQKASVKEKTAKEKADKKPELLVVVDNKTFKESVKSANTITLPKLRDVVKCLKWKKSDTVTYDDIIKALETHITFYENLAGIRSVWNSIPFDNLPGAKAYIENPSDESFKTFISSVSKTLQPLSEWFNRLCGGKKVIVSGAEAEFRNYMQGELKHNFYLKMDDGGGTVVSSDEELRTNSLLSTKNMDKMLALYDKLETIVLKSGKDVSILMDKNIGKEIAAGADTHYPFADSDGKDRKDAIKDVHTTYFNDGLKVWLQSISRILPSYNPAALKEVVETLAIIHLNVAEEK